MKKTGHDKSRSRDDQMKKKSSINKDRKNSVSKNKKIIFKKDAVIISILFIAFLIFFLYLSSISTRLLWDETVYLGNARGYITQSNFTEEFRYPMLSWSVALIWLVTGENIIAAKIFVILLSVLSIILFYLISKRYLSLYPGLIATILFGLSPLIMFWGFRIYTDVSSIFFVLLSYYLLLRADEIGRKNVNHMYVLMILSGMAAGLSFLMRFPHGLFIVCIVLFLLYKKNLGKTITFCLGIAVTLIPWMIYNYITHNNPLWDLIAQYTLVNAWTNWEPMSQQLVNLFLYNSLSIIILFIVGLFVMIYLRVKKWEFLLIYIVIAFIAYLFLIRLKDARYYITILPFIYIIAFIPIDYLLKKKKKIVSIGGIVLLIIVIMTTLAMSLVTYNKIQENHLCDNDSITQSIAYLKTQNVDIQDTILASNVWPWYGYHLNMKVSSLWDKDYNLIVIDSKNPQYIAYSNTIDAETNKAKLDENPRLKLEKEFNGTCNDKVYLYKKEY